VIPKQNARCQLIWPEQSETIMRFLSRCVMGLFLLALTLALLAAAIGSLIGGGAERANDFRMPPKERVLAARVGLALAEDTHPILTAYGSVEASRRIELRPKASGEVIELGPNFRDGMSVEAGELLLRLNDEEARASRDLAAIALQSAKDELRDAERALSLAENDVEAAAEQEELRRSAHARQEALIARGSGTEAAAETTALALSSARQSTLSRQSARNSAEARVDQARTALARSEITLNEAERALSDTRLLAPFSGRLSGVSLSQGHIVSANEALGALIDPQSLEVAARLSTSQFARLTDANGALLPAPLMAMLNLDGLVLEAEGVLERAGAAVGTGLTGRMVFADLAPYAPFQPGDFVTLAIEEPLLSQVLRLPATAIGPRETVLVLGEDDRLEERDITLLRRMGDEVLIAADELAGRELVLERNPRLGAGLKIAPQRETDTTAQAAPPQAQPSDRSEEPRAERGRRGGPMVALSEDHRARLIEKLDSNQSLPAEARSRILGQLQAAEVPARLIERIEAGIEG